MAAMAQGICGMCPRKFVCFVLIIIALQCSHGKDVPSLSTVQTWAKDIGVGLKSLSAHKLEKALQWNYINEKKKGAFTMEYKDINEEELVRDMAKALSEMLLKKMEALNRSVIAAENAVKDHDWNQSLEIGDVHYYNTKTMVGTGIPVKLSASFGKEVNLSFSSVHIPVEIFEGDIDILNGLNWTAKLDAAFKKNYENDPDIRWQYFGSQSGFMRTYPATYWNVDGVDLYDVRRQSWYTQGSSSPKDMMILVDTSGSTYGQSLQLMKKAVKSILNTLGENDFVNVVEFSTEAKFVGKCFNHTAFVQANYRNKKQLEKDVDGLTAYGQADFSVAIRFAFEKFAEFSRNDTDGDDEDNNMGANCNKVIMLLTDGGTDNAEEVFQQYNWPNNKSVRVFTYAVGPTPNPIHAVRWMACANRGYFSQIPAMGAIRARVQAYVEILARPLAQKHIEHYMWSSSHSSIFDDPENPLTYTRFLKQSKELTGAQDIHWELTLDPRGLGMMTTVTLPVYNTTLGSSKNQTILGVMGVDVTTAQLEAQTPFEKIGPNGYSFAINPNGYVVFHPNLKTQGKFMKEPPNIDLLELEVEYEDTGSVTLEDLRTDMIKSKTGHMFISSLYLSPDRRYVSRAQCLYAYEPVANTTFRLGLNIPSYRKKYREFKGNFAAFKWPDINNSGLEMFVAAWNLRKNKTKSSDMPLTLQELIEDIKADRNPDNWNLQRLYSLYWDSILAYEMKSLLKHESASNDTEIDIDLESEQSTFVMTSGGIIMVHPQRHSAHFEHLRDLKKSSLFTRTLYSPYRIVSADYSEGPRSNTSSPPFVYLTIPIRLFEKDGGQSYPYDVPAVAGTRISHEDIMRIVNKQINDSCEDSDILCYLVDDGGFVVGTNREDHRMQVGRFLGQVDPQLMDTLNGSVYGSVSQHDFQAACKKTETTISAGFRSFTIPSFSLLTEFLNFGFWTNQISWLFSSFSLYSWLVAPIVEVEATNGEDEDKECVKVITQYYLKKDDPADPFTTFNINKSMCENCTRTFRVVKVPASNLLLIVTDAICEECSHLYPEVSQAPREITPEEEEATICELARNPRKRVQAYHCYHEDEREDQSECGCASLKLSRWSWFIALLCMAWMWLTRSR